jgi:KaiC/GvpD/RAD55 family RecA-like ATPase
MDRKGRVFGIPELDQDLAASLPSGWLTLLISATGAGSHLFAKQFAQAGVGSTPVLYYTTYERTAEVEKVFRDLGWDPKALKIRNLAEEYYDRVLSRNLEISRARQNGIRLNDLRNGTALWTGPPAFNLSSRILGDLAQIDTPFRLTLDSLDFLLEVLEPQEVISVARQVIYRAQIVGGQALVLIHANVHAQRTIGLLEDMADMVVELSTETKGRKMHHVLTIRKIRNHPDRVREVSLSLGQRGFSFASESG